MTIYQALSLMNVLGLMVIICIMINTLMKYEVPDRLQTSFYYILLTTVLFMLSQLYTYYQPTSRVALKLVATMVVLVFYSVSIDIKNASTRKP